MCKIVSLIIILGLLMCAGTAIADSKLNSNLIVIDRITTDDGLILTQVYDKITQSVCFIARMQYNKIPNHILQMECFGDYQMTSRIREILKKKYGREGVR